MIWLIRRASVVKLPTELQFSKLLVFLMEKQIQKFNLLITELVFLWVDVYFSDSRKLWTCVMKMPTPLKKP